MKLVQMRMYFGSNPRKM